MTHGLPLVLVLLLLAPARPAARGPAAPGSTVPVSRSQGPTTQAPPVEAVNAAIDRGVDFLLRSQNRDGSWGLELHRKKPWDEHRDGATALALYALLKCGQRPDHPAVRRAVAFLVGGDPWHTYAIGFELLALQALGDPALDERIEDLAERLLDLQDRSGWDYGKPDLGMGRADLSNTQVAALGLRAARLAGVRLPATTWSELARLALRYQQRPEPVPGAQRGTARRLRAGFAYAVGGEQVSASMTTAGLTVLGVAVEGDARLAERHTAAREQGLAWLETNFSAADNLGGPDYWLDYYLYGLERVGALFGVERLGDHDWYGEGAAVFLRRQEPDGAWRKPGLRGWPPAPLSTASTAFALLFLRRATLSHTGGLPLGLRAQESDDSEVWVRVDPGRTWTLWVSGFSPGARGRLAGDDDSGSGAPDFTVERVVWRVDGEELAVVEGRADEAWTEQRYPARWQAPDSAPHTVECRLSARSLRPGAAPIELRSLPLVAAASAVLEPWTLEYASDDTRNLLRGMRVAIEASSEERLFGEKEYVLDGLQGSAWSPQAGDPAPWIRLVPAKAVRAREIWIGPAPANRDGQTRFETLLAVELVLNGERETIRLELDPDPGRKTRYELPRPRILQSLEVRLIDVARRQVGLAEVEVR